MDKVCQKCINFLEYNNTATCDYDNFNNVKIDIAILYVPDMFDCDYHEEIEE